MGSGWYLGGYRAGYRREGYIPAYPPSNSDIAPPSSGLALWLRGDLGVTASSGLVSRWADQSGNGNDYTQSTGADKPSTGGSINGQAGLVWNGTSDFLVSSLNLQGANTHVIVFKLTAPLPINTFQRIHTVIGSTGPVSSELAVINSVSYPLFVWNTDSNANPMTFGPLGRAGDTAPHVLIRTYNGSGNTNAANFTANLDGNDETVFQNASGFTPATTGQIATQTGSSFDKSLNATVCEVLTYNRVLSAPEIALLKSYLSARYAISAPPNTGLVAWFRADAGVTLSGSNVTAWADSVGSNDVHQTTGGSQPLFNASSINGLPGITFDGGRFLQSVAATSPVGANSARTLVAVTKVSSGGFFGSGGFLLSWRITSNSPTSSFTGIAATGASQINLDPSSTNFAQQIPGNPTVGTPYVVELAWNGNPLNQFTAALNGTSQPVTGGNGSTESESGSAGFRIGARVDASAVYNGDICEIIIYDHVVTGSDLTALRKYLQTRYAISLGV